MSPSQLSSARVERLGMLLLLLTLIMGQGEASAQQPRPTLTPEPRATLTPVPPTRHTGKREPTATSEPIQVVTATNETEVVTATSELTQVATAIVDITAPTLEAITITPTATPAAVPARLPTTGTENDDISLWLLLGLACFSTGVGLLHVLRKPR